MSNITDEYEMEAGTSGLLETCDESRMLIETVDTIVEKNTAQEDNYFVVTEVNEEQASLIQITEADKLDDAISNDQKQPWLEMCRICANTSDHLIPIFKGEGLEHELNNKIHKYLPIQVSEQDNLPLHLCYHCAATLLAWHELANGCLEAEQRLLQMQDEFQQKDQLNMLDESLDEEESAVLTTEDGRLLIKNQLPDEDLAVKEECNEASSPNDSERLHGEEYTVNVLQIPKAEIEESSNEEKLESVECGECEATFIEFYDLAAHMNSEHNDFVHYCSYCKAVYRGDVEDFKEHEKTHATDYNAVEKFSKNSVCCTLCNENLSSVAKLKQHLLEHVNGRLFPAKTESECYTCNSCEKSFSRKLDLKRHMHMHEDAGYIENDEEIQILKDAKVMIDDRCLYKCNTCNKHIITKRGFLRHIRIHTGNRPCRCDICGNQYRIKQDLARHVRDVHERIKKYQCGICARPFANKGAKEDHERIHTGERPYSCKLCKKTFRTLNSIYIHNRIHTNYKPHKCPSCDKQFPSRQRLNNHMTTHTGVKKFSCEICLKLFSVKGEVVRHRAIHSQDKPFLCTSCGLKFGQKRYLRNHIKQHHKEQSALLLAKLTEVSH